MTMQIAGWVSLNSFLVKCRINNIKVIVSGGAVFHTDTLYDVEHWQNGSAL